MYKVKDLHLQKRKNKIELQLPSFSICTGLFKVRVFFSASRILRYFWLYFMNISDSSALILHLQRAVVSNN